MNRQFVVLKEEVLAKLEEFAAVKCPAGDYKEALESVRDEIDTWFEASIAAADDDLERQEEDE